MIATLSLIALTHGVSAAEDNQLIVVPSLNKICASPAHEAPITLKGIIRNAQCGSYNIRWDINQMVILMMTTDLTRIRKGQRERFEILVAVSSSPM